MRDETRCVSRVEVSLKGFDTLAVPVFRASTIRYADAQSFATRFERGPDDYVYGLYGTPTHRYLEQKITQMEAGTRTVLTPSGQAAITCAMLCVLGTGDRVLIPDSAYGPVRDFADRELSKLGIAVIYYDPCDMAALTRELETPTRLVWVETPGSVTMEVQDVPAIVAIARACGALVGCDNTWASPLNFKPLVHGVDIVVEALSKHFSGHSDVLMGSITVCDEKLGLELKSFIGRMGINASPDDCALVMRGIETMAVRLKHASANGIKIAQWLTEQPAVARVLHPALPGDPGHHIWQRDFSGAAGVFSFELDSCSSANVLAALDALELISIGASWGGTKSLLAPVSVKALRSARPWTGTEFLLRLSVGMEAFDDLSDDLARFFAALKLRAVTGAVSAA
ncbi:cystathionine beta-lyase [Mesorhizobium sp. STM 4661]|uniref:cystathionine beta-lyase n=1 Tax=Mesorhizobium sp. STM 4661 TaxID=1297570 RepID=UPI0006854FFF|nr:cystathionine beta-lyase [Mesorhizobium sp. STM 4661]